MLNEKVAIITGASRGIGAATAKLFAKYGANVVVNYANNMSAEEEIVEFIRENGGQSIAIQADVRNRGQMSSLVNQTISRFGKVEDLKWINKAESGYCNVSF